MANEKHLTEGEILPEHLDAPASTGCIWRVPYFSNRQKRSGEAKKHKHSGLEGTASYCCNHAHNSYQECKEEGRAKYHATDWLQKLDAIHVDYRKYHQKQDATYQRAKKILSGKTKQEKLRLWAENFSKDNWWAKYFQAAWGDPRVRLRKNPEFAWKVGYEVDGEWRRDPEYLGTQGAHLLWKANRAPPEKMPPNHADGSVPRALGFWYPYPHNHHHIITIGKMKALLNEAKPSADSEATPELRKYVLVTSGWNINGRRNMLILPTDVTVGKVIELPAHTPWGARDHPRYGDDVWEKLKPILKKLNEACDAAKGDKHKVAAEAAGEIKAALERISDELRSAIEGGTYGRQL